MTTLPLPSQDRLLDAEELERLVKSASRPSVQIQLESMAKKLRKEAEALRRVEASSSANNTSVEGNMIDVSPPVETVTPTSEIASEPVPVPVLVPKSVKYTPIDRFSFDAGGYNEEYVTIYVSLPGVGSIPRENVQCNFQLASFDLVVENHADGKSYRLFKDRLEHDINMERCKIVIKADKVIVKLAKKKQEYGGYEYWSKLVDAKRSAPGTKEDPQKSIMQLMKDMYDSGDDQMKKIIGETMMKQQRGELGKEKDYMEGLDGM